ncbi:hypothetical protein CEY04_06805 [Achromobacter sp. HZ28]|nr:hypothetical protein CEY05_16885 [Achromobacter sp. HZ34]OWT78779.1 hypothetical protein CEY04_06805 [Achromobacter sp. HZ28]
MKTEASSPAQGIPMPPRIAAALQSADTLMRGVDAMRERVDALLEAEREAPRISGLAVGQICPGSPRATTDYPRSFLERLQSAVMSPFRAGTGTPTPARLRPDGAGEPQ